MSDQRPDDETLGRALGRAVETQSVRETPYAASRLAHRIDRPAGRGWTYALPAVAALALFLAMGAFIVTRGPQGEVASPDTSASPAASPAQTARATLPPPSGTPTGVVPLRVYFARDGVPPIGAELRVAIPSGADTAQRITGRLTALVDARQSDVPAGASTAVGLSAAQRAQVQPVFTSTVSGDLATVDLTTAQRWPISGSAMEHAFLQQLVYTATEEPGIRRVLFTGSGGKPLTIDQLVLDKPLSREDVLRYGFLGTKESRVSIGDSDLQPRAIADWRASVDDVSPGLTRFVVEFVPSALAPRGFAVPRFTAGLEPNTNAQQVHKWELRVTMPDAIWPEVARMGTPFACCAVKPFDRTPLRWISAGPESAGNASGVIFTLALDDARPWRTTVLQSPLRLVIDIGGAQHSVSESVAVYAPASGATVSPRFTVSGLARAFEANVSWRVRASSGSVVASGFTTASIGTGPIWGSFQTEVALPSSVSGSVTLEVFWTSPRDGSDTGLVGIPLQVR